MKEPAVQIGNREGLIPDKDWKSLAITLETRSDHLARTKRFGYKDYEDEKNGWP